MGKLACPRCGSEMQKLKKDHFRCLYCGVPFERVTSTEMLMRCVKEKLRNQDFLKEVVRFES